MAKGKRKSIGALWKQKNGKGMTYFTGNIDGMDVVIFKNGFKEEQKAGAPDFLMYESVPLEPKAKSGGAKESHDDDDF